jgi:hypothetical protein
MPRKIIQYFVIFISTGNTIEDNEVRIEPPDRTASEGMLQSFVGRYATLNMLGAVASDEKMLDANFERYKFRLIPSSNGKFGVEKRLLGLFPLKKIGSLELAKLQVGRTDFAGREVLSVHYDNRHWFSADKLNPKPLPVTWEGALGKYQIINPDKHSTPEDIRLSKKEGVLELSYNLP